MLNSMLGAARRHAWVPLVTALAWVDLVAPADAHARPSGFVTLGQDASEPRVLVEATHERLEFDRDITRIAVGRSETLSVEILNTRELLVLGRESGRTSVVVWFADGEIETLDFLVEPDLTLLRSILEGIHPGIRVDSAPAHDALILRGSVPRLAHFRAAEAAAGAFLQKSSKGESSGPIVPGDDDVGVQPADSGNRRNGAVVNLLQVDEVPILADETIRRALEPLVGDSVTVRRVSVGALLDDSRDLFVLEGSVPDQVTLTRVLFLASRALLGDETSGRNDIRVLADEAGALTEVQNPFGSAAGAGGGRGNNQGLSFGLGGGSNQGRGGQQLVNRIGSNLGRAKVVEAAGGRVLSMITVEDLPLVRVDVRLYEVNLTRLRQWRNEIGLLGSNFDQGSLQPADIATGLQDLGAASVGQDDLQGALGFLGGQLGGQAQYVAGGFAIDSLFSLLVREQVAQTLSRPTLSVLSGEPALFQVGGQIPIPVAVTVGGGTDQILNSVEFREFGIQLAIRPLVEEIDSETLTLDLLPQVSLPDLDLTAAIGSATGASPGTTAFETRGTRTHMRLRDGDALMIGGLISQRQQEALSKTPLLGDLPVLGPLFRNETRDSEEVELVIVVNPVIVRPRRPDAQVWAFGDTSEILEGCLEASRGHHRAGSASGSHGAEPSN